MSYGEQQKKEIETIRERNITEETLLNFLLYRGYDVYDDFLEIIDDIETGYAELEDYRKDPSVFDEEEIEFLKNDIEDWEQRIIDIKADFFKENEKADWEKEVEKVNEWWKAKERLRHEQDKTEANEIKVTDRTGDNMVVQLEDIDQSRDGK